MLASSHNYLLEVDGYGNASSGRYFLISACVRTKALFVSCVRLFLLPCTSVPNRVLSHWCYQGKYCGVGYVGLSDLSWASHNKRAQ